MGKNTMMKRSIRLFCERTGNEEWPGLVDSLVGNVGLIFTKGDLNEVWPLFNPAWDLLPVYLLKPQFSIPEGVTVVAPAVVQRLMRSKSALGLYSLYEQECFLLSLMFVYFKKYSHLTSAVPCLAVKPERITP